MTVSKSSATAVAAVALLVVIGCARIVSTYGVFSATFDEPIHLSAGMEWWSLGTYTYDPQHPPLERVAAAFPLWLQGIRTIGNPEGWTEGTLLLNSRGRFQHDLALARSGVLVFFVLACVVVFLWARTLFGPWIAVACLFEFTMIPTVLGHSGLVTSDSAAMATLSLGVFAFLRWVDVPSTKRLVAAGVCLGIAILGKFSALPFLAACALAWAILNCVAARRFHLPVRINRKTVAVFLVTLFLTIWAGYRFQFEPLSAAQSVKAYRARLAPDSWLHSLELRALEIPLPAGNIIRGVAVVFEHERGDKLLQYFRGDVGYHGWPLFFPVGLAVKTPLPFLILALAGVILALLVYPPRGDLATVYPGAFAVAMLLVCVPAHINLGTRHILPLYPLLAVASGLAIRAAWNARRHRALARIAAAAMLLWLPIESAVAHPDYMAYFNELTAGHPEKILVESDIDWGQDLLRLKKEVDAAGIEDLHLSYAASVDPALYGLRYTRLQPGIPVSGWVAVTLHHLAFEPSDYAWLAPYSWRMVGKSVRLYFVPAPAPLPAAAPSRAEALARLGLM